MNQLQLNPITFPLWWYTVGFRLVCAWALRQFRFGLKTTGIIVFIRYMRHPLYGDYTRSGRIISFLIRVVLLIFKILVLGLRILVLLAFLISYLLILPFAFIMVAYQFVPLEGSLWN